jgi:hypothetical protein
MKGLWIHHATCTLLLSTSLLFAQSPAAASEGPVPPALRTAKAIFVSNAGSDSGLFPQPFTGIPSRTYSSFYQELKAAGQFTLVDDPSQADLVLELRLTAPCHLTPFNPKFGEKEDEAASHLPMFRLVIYDRKTHYILWTLTQSIEYAILQKTHDRNFDRALSALLANFQVLTGKPPRTTP